MVIQWIKQSRHQSIRIVALLFVLLSMLSCAEVSRWWGEKAQEATVVRMPVKDSGCPDFIRVADSTESVSTAALECWVDKIDGIWSDVRGAKKNQLSDAELYTLIRKGVFTLSNDAEKDYNRVLAVKKLLGIRGSLSRTLVREWVDFARNHREQLRLFWVHMSDPKLKITQDHVLGFIAISIPLLEKMDWKMGSDQLAHLINIVIEPENKYLRGAMNALMDVAFNAYTSICPTFTNAAELNTNELALCIARLMHAFTPGRAWFEYVFNPYPFKSSDEEILQAMDFLHKKVGEWFSHANLKYLDFRLWVDFAKQLQARPPVHLFDTMVWIRNFNTRSNEYHLHPLAYRRFFEVIKEFHTLLLDGQRVYFKELSNNRCKFSSKIRLDRLPDWKDCILTNYPQAQKDSPSIDLLMRAKNLDAKHSPVEFSGGDFLKTSLIHAISRQIVIAFGHDKDVIGFRSILGESDEVMEMIGSLVAFQENAIEFLDNIDRRLSGRMLVPLTKFETFANFDLRGLAQLVAMVGSDILVHRTEKEQIYILKMMEEITRVNPTGSQVIDQLALTGVLSLVDSLESYRDRYMGMIVRGQTPPQFETRGDSLFLNRESLVDSIPKILEFYYPRTYRHCNDFISFRRTCGLVFDSIMPWPDAGSSETLINASNLDLITLVATGMESMVDTCDKNRNGELDRDILGTGELACVQRRAIGTALRLMDADIIHQKSDWFLNFMHDSINFLSITRLIPRYVLTSPFVRGDLRPFATIVDLLPHTWNDNGTLGSLYALLAWLIDEDRAKALDKEYKRYHLAGGLKPPITMPRDVVSVNTPTALEILNHQAGAFVIAGPMAIDDEDRKLMAKSGFNEATEKLLAFARSRFSECWKKASTPEEKQDCRSSFLRDLGLEEQHRPR